MKHLLSCWIGAISLFGGAACAASVGEVGGLWMTAQKDAVVEFKPCSDREEALCGHIVWDKDAGTPADTCGVHIVRLERLAGDVWRDGWAYDPRDRKKYKATLRIKDGALLLRAYIGVEVLGQTESFSRVTALPPTPSCKN